MEIYTNIILTLIFISAFFIVIFLNRNTSATNELSSKIECLNITLNNSENTLDFCKLQLEELKKSLSVLSIKVKSYEKGQ